MINPTFADVPIWLLVLVALYIADVIFTRKRPKPTDVMPEKIYPKEPVRITVEDVLKKSWEKYQQASDEEPFVVGMSDDLLTPENTRMPNKVDTKKSDPTIEKEMQTDKLPQLDHKLRKYTAKQRMIVMATILERKDTF